MFLPPSLRGQNRSTASGRPRHIPPPVARSRRFRQEQSSRSKRCCYQDRQKRWLPDQPISQLFPRPWHNDRMSYRKLLDDALSSPFRCHRSNVGVPTMGRSRAGRARFAKKLPGPALQKGSAALPLSYIACRPLRPKAPAAIHTAIAIIIRFSVSEMKPSGTLLDPPTQAHFSSRLST